MSLVFINTFFSSKVTFYKVKSEKSLKHGFWFFFSFKYNYKIKWYTSGR